MSNPHFWTLPRVERLKTLTGQGLSSGQIASLLAREFGEPVSRNAVIGKLMRGKGKYGRLSPRRLGALQTPARHSLPSGAGRTGAVSDKAAPVRHYASRAAGAPAGRRNGAGLRSEPWPAAVVPVNLPTVLPIGFFEAVEAGRCLHFIGDPMGPDGPGMPVCGAERAEGAPFDNRYCRRHRASQYQARVVA